MPQWIYRKSALALTIIGYFCATLWPAERPVQADDRTAARPDDSWQTIKVEKTFNNLPFDYQIKFQSQRNGYRVYKINFPSPVKTAVEQNNTAPAEYYLPDDISRGLSQYSRGLSQYSRGLSQYSRGLSQFSRSENGTVPLVSSTANVARRPAVICLPILDGNDALTDLVCSVLALRGIPAIMFRLPYYGERGLAGGPEVLAKDPKMFTAAIAQAGEDLRRTIDILASRPEIDPDRIGVAGISLGGIIAATAAGGEPRINRAALILAGGDLMKIIHHAQETKPLSKMILALPQSERDDIEGKIARADPLRFASGLKEKARQGKILMINAAEDEVVPRECTEKLAAAMDISNRVVWVQNLGHYTSMAELPKTLKGVVEFFVQDLPPGVKPPAVENRSTPFQIIAGLFAQTAAMLDTKPEPGKCHIADLEITITRMEDQTRQEGRFRLVRGAQGKFAFSCKIYAGGLSQFSGGLSQFSRSENGTVPLTPTLDISIGQNVYPWMAVGAKEVYEGTENPGPAMKDPMELFDPKQTALLKMFCGVLKSVSLAPDVLERLIAAKDAGDVGFDNSVRTIQILPREKEKFPARLQLKFDRIPSQFSRGLSQFSHSENGTVPLASPENVTTPSLSSQQYEYAPQTVKFSFSGAEGVVKFVEWKLNAPEKDSLFQPPANLPRHKVDQSFLYTLFSTSLKFALGTVN